MKRKLTIPNIIFFILFLITLFTHNCIAQKELNKEELLNYWKTNVLVKPEKKDSILQEDIIYFKNITNNKFTFLIDSLKLESIDTFGIYIVGSPSGFNADSCRIASYMTIYFLWQKNRKFFVRKLINHCDYGNKELPASSIFEYAKDNFQILKEEFFMPVILRAKLDSANRLKWTSMSNTEDYGYGLYFWSGKDYFSFDLCDSDIDNKESLFYEYNRNLKSYSLYEIIEKELKGLY